nr:RNA-directed DNA polymerase, eukaryota [Tanacetum cinerariifolium]
MEDNADSSFGRKCVCIMTKHPVSILETFKIIAKGKVYMVRAKELFTWNHIFTASKEEEIMLDGESCHASKNDADNNHPNDEASDDESASDVDAVSDLFLAPTLLPIIMLTEIWIILNRRILLGVSAKVMYCPSQEVPVESNSEAMGQNAVNNGGSVLGVMEDIIHVGQAMGYTMEGCVSDLERIVGQQGVNNGFR